MKKDGGAAPGRQLPIMLVSDMWPGIGKFVLLGIVWSGFVITMLAASNARVSALWLLASAWILLGVGVLCWTRRLYVDPVTGGLYEESGWPWLGLTSGRQAGVARDFDLVLRSEVALDRHHVIALELVGRQTLQLLRRPWPRGPGSEAVSLTKAAAIALLLGMPLEERPGPSGRAERLPPQDMRRLVERALRGEITTTHVRTASASILFGHAFTIAGVLFVGWSPLSVFALFWFDLCVITLFAILRAASADAGDGVYAFMHWCKVLVTAGGMFVAAGLAGYLMMIGLDLTGAPAMTLGGMELPTLLAVVVQGLDDGNVWVFAAILAASQLIAFVIDLRRGASRSPLQADRFIVVITARIACTMAVAGIALKVVAQTSGAGAALFVALVIAARGLFEVWAYLRVNAPLHLSGDLELMRAARAAAIAIW